MSKRSGPERRPRDPRRADLLELAGAVADGRGVDWSGPGQEQIRAGLQVIAGLSERLGAVFRDGHASPRQPVLFQWGHLDVLERIGEGASSEVYRAYDPLLAVEVALKLSRPGLGWAGAGEWIAEARRQARLRHPNIVAIHGVDRHDGRAGLWLDLVDGETLDAWGRRVGPLESRELCLIGIELCRGLAAIHDADLRHCDLKPANLLRGRDGRILIADFGAAASARAEDVGLVRRGTPLTMAPEVLAGGEASIRSDLYGLGVVLFWLASGRMPRAASDLEQLRAQHRDDDDRSGLADGLPAATPGAVKDLLLRLLAIDPARRPAGAAEVEALLASALASNGGEIAGSDQRQVPAFQRVLGREAEFAYLQQEYRRALGGQALPVLLIGESGTGKSALASRFEAWLGQVGARMLRIVAGAGPVAESLPDLFARQLASEQRGRAQRRHDHEPSSVAQRLAESTERPLVLCLDDLHRLDAGERTWLRRFAACLRGSQILLLCLLRSPSGDDRAAIDLFADAPAALLRLRVFSPEQSGLMIAELLLAESGPQEPPPGLVEQLHQLSGGNPFFLSELLRHLVAERTLHWDPDRGWRWQAGSDALPPSLELAALQRCRSLPADSLRVLEVAAVWVDEFDVDVLARLLDASAIEIEAWLQPAVLGGIIEPLAEAAPGWRFRHGLIRRALYEALPAERRRELHARCVEMYRYRNEARALTALSLHAERAGEDALAFSAGYAALSIRGDDAVIEPAAGERLQALLDAGVSAPTSQRWRLALARLRALRLHGRLQEAQALTERIDSTLAPRRGSRNEKLLRLERAQIALAQGAYRTVLTLLEVGAIESGTPTVSKPTADRSAELLAVRAQAALGDYREAEQRLHRALELAPTARRQRLPMQTLLGWCIALQGRLDEADHALDEARHMARGSPPAIRADVLRRLHWVRLGRGCYQDAHALALAAHQLYRELGDAVGQAKIRMALAQVRLCQGLTEEAMGYLNRAGHELEDIGDKHCEAETRWLLARGLTGLGEFTAAEHQLDLALDQIVQIGDRDDEFRFLIERARLWLAWQRPADAVQAASEAGAIAADLDSRDGQAFAEIEQAAAKLMQGQAQAALELAAPAGRRLHALGAGERWRADWLLGRCHLALGDPESAIMALARAQAVVEAIVAEFDRSDQARRSRLCQAWQPLIDLHAQALDAAGRVPEAQRLLRRWQRQSGQVSGAGSGGSGRVGQG